MTQQKHHSTGVLYIVATPIGNLNDISHRALQILEQVDLIAAEDTRVSSHLLNHYNIQTKLTSYHAHNEAEKTSKLLKELENGISIALISDAGTPLISDPGKTIVTAAKAAGIRVVPIPGACAVIAALSASGLNQTAFSFYGFLPSKASARVERLQALASQTETLVFYESPHRIRDSISAMASVFGEARQGCLAREISKKFETITTAPLADLVAQLADETIPALGEFVVLIEGVAPQASQPDELSEESVRVLGILLKDLPLKQAAKLSSAITGESKNKLYQKALTMTAD